MPGKRAQTASKTSMKPGGKLWAKKGEKVMDPTKGNVVCYVKDDIEDNADKPLRGDMFESFAKAGPGDKHWQIVTSWDADREVDDPRVTQRQDDGVMAMYIEGEWRRFPGHGKEGEPLIGGFDEEVAERAEAANSHKTEEQAKRDAPEPMTDEEKGKVQLENQRSVAEAQGTKKPDFANQKV